MIRHMETNTLDVEKWVLLEYMYSNRKSCIYGLCEDSTRFLLRRCAYGKRWKNTEAEVCPDHIHMQVSIPSRISGSGIAGLLKGKSSLIIIERYANLKYRHGNSLFWRRGN